MTIVDFRRQNRVRSRVSPENTLEARCRVGLSNTFGLLDRIKFLFSGRLWVVTVNGKAHTSVVLTMRKPRDA